MSDRQQIQSNIDSIIRNLQGTVSIPNLKNYLTILLFYRFLSDKNMIPDSLKLKTIMEQSNADNFHIILKDTFKQIEEKIQHKNIDGTLTSFDFNNIELGNTDKEKNDKINRIINSVYKFNLSDDIDLFGYISEYFMGLSTSNGGSVNGEYYTPSFVADLMYKLVTTKKQIIHDVYDPTCGSGSLLINFAKNGHRVYGQEINNQSCIMCKINLLLHSLDINSFDIRNGDTITQPKHLGQQFDVIVSNPPFSVHYDRNDSLLSDERYSPAKTLPPRTKGDLLFMMHSLHHLTDDGIICAVEFPGALYRTGAEQSIRKYMVENNFVDGVIQLPGDIFENTTIPVCLLILNKNRTHESTIRFINAANLYTKATNRNIMEHHHINQIVEMYFADKDNEISKRIPVEDVKNNGCHLSPNMYLTTETKEIIDIDKLEKEIAEMKARRRQIEDELDAFIESLGFR